MRKRGFTLIELLIVIAIIAILAIIVILALNPAQLFQQSRDSDRLSDLPTMSTAVGAYMADQAGASGFSLGSSSVTYISIPDPTATVYELRQEPSFVQYSSVFYSVLTLSISFQGQDSHFVSLQTIHSAQ